MSVAPVNPADPGFSSTPGEASSPVPGAAEPALEAGLPVVGQPWQDVYQVQLAVGEGPGPRVWRALRVDTGEEVLLRALTIRPGNARPEAWRVLETLSHPNLSRAVKAVEFGAQRVEVQSVPPGRTLRDRRDGRAADAAFIAQLVRPLAAAIGALHERGLGHFAIRPEHVYLAEREGALQVTLAGLDRATLCDSQELVPIAVDPFYAPPEAAGLFQHSPGEGLRAWDWWSLGRVLQEYLLGKHVLSVLLQRDVSRATPELTARAENLLLAREAGATRAGAIEALPAHDKRVEQLLRGLLSSARDARWGREQVEAWLRGESPKDYYRLSRNDRMFRWRGRVWTIPEVAVELRTAEHWTEAMAQIAEFARPGTLAHFIADSPAYRPLRDKLEELRRLADTTALKEIASDIVRDVITSLSLLELAGSNLVWRGHSFDQEGLRAIFAVDGHDGSDRLALLRAFTARPVMLLIEHCDPDAARALVEFAQTAAAAEALVRQQRWLRERDTAGLTRLLQAALLPVGELHRQVAGLHERFASSTDATVDKLFQQPNPARAELVAIAWLGGAPGHFGFLTHLQRATIELERLQTEGAGVVTALFWSRIHRPLALGPVIFARWRWVVPGWLLLGLALAFVWPGPRWVLVAVAPIVLALILRLLGGALVRSHLRRTVVAAAPWRWRDSRVRSRMEKQAALGERTPAALKLALRDINAGIARLTLIQPAPGPLRVSTGAAGLWSMMVVGWLVLAGALVLGGWHARQHRPSWAAFVKAWDQPKPKPPPPVAKASGGGKHEPDGPVRVTWPFKRGDNPEMMRTTTSVELTGETLRQVGERGRAMAARYKPETITTLVVFEVTVEEKRGLVVYDLRKLQPVVPKVFLVDYLPLARSWIDVEGHEGVYLQE